MYLNLLLDDLAGLVIRTMPPPCQTFLWKLMMGVRKLVRLFSALSDEKCQWQTGGSF